MATDLNRIDDFDFYVGVALICFSLKSTACGTLAAGAAIFIFCMTQVVRK